MPGRRLTIGVLVDRIEDAYHAAVLSGAAAAARDADANLVYFAGGVLGSEHRAGLQRNVVFELAGPETLDGILVTGALGNAVGAAELRRFCARFEPLPMASIAIDLEGMPSVLVDNASGMRDAVAHVVVSHGRRNVAFIRGPVANEEAERRFQVYREVLAAHGISVAKERIAHGDFERQSGAEAIRGLLDRGVGFDALAAASDQMAMGAMDELRARGIGVPDDVAVVGFDDAGDAPFTLPPLSTVRQPLDEQGRRGIEALLARIRGETVPERIVLPTSLVTRRSCGCTPVPEAPGRSSVPPDAGLSFEALSAERSDELAGDAAGALGAGGGTVGRGGAASEREIVARVLGAFVLEVGSGERGATILALEDALRVRLAEGVDIHPWQDALSALRKGTQPWMAGRSDLRARADDLWQELRVLTARYAEAAQVAHRRRIEQLARELADTSEALMATFDRPKLRSALAERLPRLGVPSAALSVYRDRKNPAKRSRLVFSLAAASLLPSLSGPEPGAVFPSRQLAPPGFLPLDRRWEFVVEPLFFRGEPTGFVLLEMGPRDGMVYETLRDQISAALEGADLVAKVVEHDRERQRLLRYVLDVTPDMHRVQPPADLYQTILVHAVGMLEAGSGAPSSGTPPGANIRTVSSAPAPAFESLLPPAPISGLFAAAEDSRLVVRAVAGRFAAGDPLERSLDAEALERTIAAMDSRAVAVHPGAMILPLGLGDVALGVIYLEHEVPPPDVALLSTFAMQASAAIRSMQLYEMAALDPLTGTHARRFFEDWLEREVRAAWRSRQPVSLFMVDADALKRINDTAGHLAGDEALATIGRALRKATRQNDVVGRYGGDEFVVVLPSTNAEAAERVAARVLEALEGGAVGSAERPLPLRISIGISTLRPDTLPPRESMSFPPPGSSDPPTPRPTAAGPLTTRIIGPHEVRKVVERLIANADEALYAAKRQGGMRFVQGPPTDWG